jgi:NitT/TauT family transport system substrate-binding protein
MAGVATTQIFQLDKSYGADGMVVKPNVPSSETPGLRWPFSPRSLIPIRGMAPRGTRDEAAKT